MVMAEAEEEWEDAEVVVAEVSRPVDLSSLR